MRLKAGTFTGTAPAVGLLGLGAMGSAMASSLRRAGLLAAVHNRTWERCRAVASELGVRGCRTIAELAEASAVLITMVSDAQAIRDVYDGPSGLLANLHPGTLCLEMSTIGPEAAVRLGAGVAAAGCTLIDAPVSGSTEMAATGQLTILLGGDIADVQRARPVLDALGRQTFHVGPLGAGATMKLAVNNVIYGLNQSLAESLVLAEQAGVDRERAYEIFASSAAAAPFVHYRRALFEDPQGEPVQMRLDLAAKDLTLIEALAARVGARLPQAQTNQLILQEAIASGLGANDVSAVAEHLRMG